MRVFEGRRPCVQAVMHAVAIECNLWSVAGALALQELLTRQLFSGGLAWAVSSVMM